MLSERGRTQNQYCPIPLQGGVLKQAGSQRWKAEQWLLGAAGGRDGESLLSGYTVPG